MYDTDQEQIEAIKAWWNANANWVIAGILVLIFAFAGWNWYQSEQVTHKEDASRLYDRLLVNVSSPNSDLNEQASMINALKSDYSDLGYSVMASLFEAKGFVDAEDYDSALKALSWSLANGDKSLLPVIHYRIALVQFELNNYDSALASLAAIKTDGHQALSFELKGDILLAQADETGARDAYQSALDFSAEQGIQNPYLQIKLDDLAVAK